MNINVEFLHAYACKTNEIYLMKGNVTIKKSLKKYVETFCCLLEKLAVAPALKCSNKYHLHIFMMITSQKYLYTLTY